MALCSDGTLVAWGYNNSGELGNGTSGNGISVPVTVTTSGALSGKRVTSIFGGGALSMAMCSDGTVVAWGDNQYGELGNNSLSNSNVPTTVSTTSLGSGETFLAITSGSSAQHGLALVADPIPVITSLASASSIAGSSFNYVVTASGFPTSFGATGLPAGLTINTSTGMISGTSTLTGTFAVTLSATNPVATATSTLTLTVSPLLTAVYNSATDIPVATSSITTGSSVNFVLKYAPATGTNLTVVKNTGLGFIQGTFTNLAQDQVVGLTYNGITYNFRATYYGGTDRDLVLQWADSRPVTWGSNNYGELGNNSTTNTSVPTAVTMSGVLSGKTIVAMSAGAEHTLGLCSDGTVASWGYNGGGELGNNSMTNSSVPVAVISSGVLSGKRVVAVSAGVNHSLALCSDGTVAAWGQNNEGELGNGTTTTSSVPVAVTTSGVLSGKTVVAISAKSES